MSLSTGVRGLLPSQKSSHRFVSRCTHQHKLFHLFPVEICVLSQRLRQLYNPPTADHHDETRSSRLARVHPRVKKPPASTRSDNTVHRVDSASGCKLSAIAQMLSSWCLSPFNLKTEATSQVFKNFSSTSDQEIPRFSDSIGNLSKEGRELLKRMKN